MSQTLEKDQQDRLIIRIAEKSVDSDHRHLPDANEDIGTDYTDPDFKTATMSRWPPWIGKRCVKVKRTDRDVQVQDSKIQDSPTLVFTHTEWRAFVDGVKKGEFDLSEDLAVTMTGK